ncbi:MAG: hypothetical protein ACYTGH_07660 [Planctomycetota bacterium]|jgi:hypothetical protein
MPNKRIQEIAKRVRKLQKDLKFKAEADWLTRGGWWRHWSAA